MKRVTKTQSSVVPVVADSYQVVDFQVLVNNAEPKIAESACQELFKAIGSSCQAIETQKKNVGQFVRELRSMGITLADWSSFQVAKMLIKQSFSNVQDRTLDKYTCNLRSYLQMPEAMLPDTMCISAPVRCWISPGAEIDVMDTSNIWWHAVALEVTKKKVKVFWVGFEKSKGGKNKMKNPVLIDSGKQCVRPHEDGSDICSGSNGTYDVTWIMQHEFASIQPRTFQDVVHCSDEESEGAASESLVESKKADDVEEEDVEEDNDEEDKEDEEDDDDEEEKEEEEEEEEDDTKDDDEEDDEEE